MVKINFASEGIVDAAIARRLIAHAGAEPGLERPAHGKHKLDPLLQKYRSASEHGAPWLILRDLDRDSACAPELLQHLGVRSADNFCMRIAIREVESWILADRQGLADFLRIPVARVHASPETLPNPKRYVIDLARSSRSRDIREAIVPHEGSGQEQGPEYAAQMAGFAENQWDVARAINDGAAASLVKVDTRLRELVARKG